MTEFLAHSARKGFPAQLYSEHVCAVCQRSTENLAGALRFFSGKEKEKSVLQNAVSNGSLLHDLGKLAAENQDVLSKHDYGGKLPINHIDAGTAWLLRHGALNSALLAYCHHRGLFSLQEESKRGLDGKLAFRDTDIAAKIDRELSDYLSKHKQSSLDVPENIQADEQVLKGFSLRLALSCLVDADHHNTACHYGGELPVLKRSGLKWKQRLEKLNEYVEGLAAINKDDESRNTLRSELYAACLNAASEPALRYCDAPVGSGKTTAVMAHLLSVAAAKNLRHIFVVLPYTNIIEQSVKVYRKAIVLKGENPEEIVAAHYHQADFSDLSTRQLATLWGAPVIVTSAVQFFETLANCKTSRLRKLHELPGSAVFVDESHAAMPLHIWPQQWKWMQELTARWGCHFVLASGSLVKFWEYPSFSDSDSSISSLLPRNLQDRLKEYEKQRVLFPVRHPPFDRHELLEFVLSNPGPRLVILNTVQSAAVIAHEMKKRNENVLHLSTALSPKDRHKIIKQINVRLGQKGEDDWTLVATSCVEAGVDFSFKTAFRESCSVTSLIQTGGRANRHGAEAKSEVIDFRVRDPFLNKHPSFEDSRVVMDQMFDEGLFNSLSPMEAATEAVLRELRRSGVAKKADEIKKQEERQEYKEVARLTRIIDADTKVVVVCQNLIEKLKKGEEVISQDILLNSVQLWSNKIKELCLKNFRYFPELYYWNYSYDGDFLGYMEGLLPVVYQYSDDDYGLIV